ncbi:MAG: MBL fold metallo-hydrolase [Vicinamibacterales bacterium]|nr:MBL fold metallo-hydrolase [Vicinamibacterales bacterium]
MALIIEARAVAPFYKNGFVVACETTRQAILIDPGDEVEDLLGIVEAQHLSVGLILLTHAHMDHVSGVACAKRATGARIGVHRDDVFLYNAAVEQGRVFGYSLEQPPPPDFDLGTGGPFTFGDREVHVHHTPGHSPGGVCLRVAGPGVTETHLFVGDTLFAGSIGRTDLPGGDYDTLMRSIREVLFAFGDGAIVHAGHGQDTTIGRERATNPFLRI